jgi:hypothetical protein
LKKYSFIYRGIGIKKILKSVESWFCLLAVLAFASCTETKAPVEKLGDEEIKAGTFPDGCVTNYAVYSAYTGTVKEDLQEKWALLNSLPARSHFDLSGNVCKIIIDKPGEGNNVSLIQLVYFPVSVESGKPYRVSFDAKAGHPRFFRFKIGREGDKWLAYSGIKEFTATTNWQTFSFIFKAMVTDDAARAEFECAIDTNSLYFRNVSMKPVLK